MKDIVTELTHYCAILIIVTYVIGSVAIAFKCSDKNDRANTRMYGVSLFCAIIFLQILFGINSYIMTLDVRMFAFYGAHMIYLVATFVLFRIFYSKGSVILLDHMLFLLTIGLTMVSRISFDKGIRQFELIVLSTILAGLIPFIMSKFKLLRKMAWLYGAVGIGLLVLVLIKGTNTYGAKLSMEIFGVAFQPSEFVKVVFVFFVAAMFEHDSGFKTIIKTSIMAAAHVLILAASRDLGSALIYAIVYVMIVFVASGKAIYLLCGLFGGVGASLAGYHLFEHVKVRVAAWINPWSDIEGKGYQMAQSLFSIATGGFAGMGLYKGSPRTIPVVEKDFIFSAMAEEFGGIICIGIVIVMFLCVYLMIKAAWESHGRFYRYMALGLGVTYGIQIFITIGGAIKLIPSTGVTLPLISYGGSSMLATVAMFSIVQGIIILKRDEDDKIEKAKLEKARREKERREKARLEDSKAEKSREAKEQSKKSKSSKEREGNSENNKYSGKRKGNK